MRGPIVGRRWPGDLMTRTGELAFSPKVCRGLLNCRFPQDHDAISAKILKPTMTEPLPEKDVQFRPSSYYRHEHPDYFSDTTEVAEPVLPRDILAFHLDQITAAKKEREFEDFCRRLCEIEICPNLLPQTGPVGGGDSKTDSSTYPVAPNLALSRWWIGHTAPTNEDWAFAFSAKKDWKAKARSDIAKIAKLSRSYTRAYFITNQAVSDKNRANLEAELTKKYGLDVRIFDRTWLLEKVTTNHHERLAVQTLALQVPVPRERRVGPRDAQRGAKFDALIAKLREADPTKTDDYVVSQDYLRAAKLASSLERPRDEVDALFQKARDLALRSGYVPAIIRTHYQHAWRSHFWYDDSAKAEELLDVMLQFLSELGDAELCELYNNLCSILETAHETGFFKQDAARLAARRQAVNARLEDLRKDYSRPNNALYAETVLLMSEVRVARSDPAAMESLFARLTKLFQKAKVLGTYPMLQFMETWEKLGDFFCDYPGYARLQREMQKITSERFGATEAGRRQVTYGWQLLEKDRYAEALAELSQARFLLSKEETLDESVDAALGCALMYRKLGHPWAARMEAVSAAQASLYSMDRFHENPRRGLFVARLIAWLELSLGRVGPFLVWHHFAKMLVLAVERRGLDASEDRYDLQMQDGSLGCLLLKVPAEEVRELRDLADAFERIGLDMARIALLSVCGREDVLRSEMPEEMQSDPNALDELIRGLRRQPAFDEVPSKLCGEMRYNSLFEHEILGVRYRVRCRNSIGPTLITESLLGVLDAAFADARWENFAFIFDEVCLHVDETSEGKNPPSLEPMRWNVVNELQQFWSPDALKWIHDNRNSFHDHLVSFLSTLVVATTIDPWEDLKRELDYWHERGVFDRILVATQNSIALTDIVGREKYDLNYWIKAAAAQEI
jgi:hypothetical protein